MEIDQNLVKELGAESLSPEMQAEVVGQFYGNLNERMSVAFAETLSPEQLETFNKITETEGEEKAVDWVVENVPNYDQIFEKEYNELKEEIKGVVEVLSANDQPA